MATSNSQTQNVLAAAGREEELATHGSREDLFLNPSTVLIDSQPSSLVRGQQVHSQLGMQPRMYQWYSEPGPYEHVSSLRHPVYGTVVKTGVPGQNLLAGQQPPESVSQQHDHDAGLDTGIASSSTLSPRTFSGGRNALPFEAGPRDLSYLAEHHGPTTTTTTNNNSPFTNRDKNPAGVGDATESVERRFPCDVVGCTKSFATTNDLSRHKASVHNVITQATNIFYCQGRSCLQNPNRCVRQWTRKDNFMVHLRTQHSDERLEDLLERSKCSQPHRSVLGEHYYSAEAPHRPSLTPPVRALAPGPWPFGQSQQIGHSLSGVADPATSQPFSPAPPTQEPQAGGQTGSAGGAGGVGGVGSAAATHSEGAAEQSQAGGALIVSSRDIIVMDGLIVHLDNARQDVGISYQLASRILSFRDRLLADRPRHLGTALTHEPPSGQPDPVQMYTYISEMS